MTAISGMKTGQADGRRWLACCFAGWFMQEAFGRLVNASRARSAM